MCRVSYEADHKKKITMNNFTTRINPSCAAAPVYTPFLGRNGTGACMSLETPQALSLMSGKALEGAIEGCLGADSEKLVVRRSHFICIIRPVQRMGQRHVRILCVKWTI